MPPDVLLERNFNERLEELKEYSPTKVFKTYQTLEAVHTATGRAMGMASSCRGGEMERS